MLPANIPQILINRERLLHKTFDIELLGNCDAIVNELCLRLAPLEPSFGQIKHLANRSTLREVLYENVCPSVPSQPKKKLKVSASTDEQEKVKDDASDQQACASLKDVDFESSYVHHPPRRYVFAGAETNFSSDESSSSSSSSDDDDDDDDDDEPLRKDKAED